MNKPRSLRPVACLVLLGLLCAGAAATPAFASSLRFHGNGVNEIDRVKIRLDQPEVPADIGAADFTIEFWLRALPGENPGPACGAGVDGWIYGHIILDRDIWGEGDHGDFGLSLLPGGVAFGVRNAQGYGSLCGQTSVDDGAWHHIAVTRRAQDGRLELFVDGRPDATAPGPPGDLSYRNGRLGAPADPFLVLGAEKHDAGAEYPSFRGWLDELRLSTTVRYVDPFEPAVSAFEPDASTAALYHFDEGAGVAVQDDSDAPGGPSDGQLQVGGTPPGPEWSDASPFAEASGDGLPEDPPDGGGTCPPDGCGTPVPYDGALRWALRASPNPSSGAVEFTLGAFTTTDGREVEIGVEDLRSRSGADSDGASGPGAADLGVSADPVVIVHDVQGRIMARVPVSAASGPIRFSWDGRRRDGAPAASGVYWARLGDTAGVGARILILR